MLFNIAPQFLSQIKDSAVRAEFENLYALLQGQSLPEIPIENVPVDSIVINPSQIKGATAGDTLIGKSNGRFTAAHLTAGSGVSILAASGSITISAETSIPLVLTENLILDADKGLIVPQHLEIGDGVSLEVGDGAIIEVLGSPTPINRIWDNELITKYDFDVWGTTFVDDPELQFDLVANALYWFESQMIYSSPLGGGTPDIKFLGAGPTGFTGQVCFPTYISTGDLFNSGIGQALITAGTAQFGTATIPRVFYAFGWVSATASGSGLGGGFRVQWAQNVSNNSQSRRHAGTKLRYRRIM